MRNRLVEIKQGAASVATFEYDALGRRAKRAVSAVTKQYRYDGANAVQELSGTRVVQANVVGGMGMDQWYFRTEGATTRHYLTDALNSTRALADDARAIQTRYQYEPFGETTTTGTVSTNASQYTGRDNDGTGLYYYRARYYHSVIKRFVSEDTIGLAGGANYYAYVGGSPTMLDDPSGNVAPIVIGSR